MGRILVITRENCMQNFSYHNEITGVVISEDVPTLASGMFQGCYNIETIDNRSSIKSFTPDVFSGCPKAKFLVDMREDDIVKEVPEKKEVASPVVEEVIVKDEPKVMVPDKNYSIPEVKTELPSFLHGVDIDKLFYMIHPQNRAKFGKTKEEIVVNFLLQFPAFREV